MLTGDPPHSGNTIQAILAKVLSEEPTPIAMTRKLVPANVEAAVERALAKIPADRFATARQFAEALENPAFRLPPTTAEQPSDHERPVSSAQRNLRTGALVIGVALVALAAGYLLAPKAVLGPPVYDVALPDSAPLSFTGGSIWGEGWTAFAASPEGDFVIYVADRGATTELWYRSLVDAEAHPLPGTNGAYHPMLSPDGNSVAFFAGDRLIRASVAGGSATTLAELDGPYGGDWVSRDRLLVSHRLGALLQWIDPASGGTLKATALPEVEGCPLPRAPADGDLVVCSGLHTAYSPPNAENKTREYLQTRGPSQADALASLLYGSDVRLVGAEYLTYLSLDGQLRAASFDAESMIVGRSATLQPGVRREAVTGAGQYAVTASGTLVFTPGDNAEVGHLVKADGRGRVDTLPIPPAAFQRFDLSRDGRQLAAVVSGVRGMELWTYDVASGRGQRWLRAFRIREPRWNPAGDRLIVDLAPEAGSPVRTVIGSPGRTSPPDTLEGLHSTPSHWVADDLILVRLLEGTFGRLDLGRLTIDTLLAAGGFPALSPDRRWLAYQSTHTGQWEVFVQRYPQEERRFQVSNRGGGEPLWLSATELVYRDGYTWYTVTVGGPDERPVSEPRRWFSDPRFSDTIARSHVATPDGAVIYLQGTAQSTTTFLRVIPNWVEQMKRAVDEVNR
jgi:serine/threonine-protein kinase